LLAREWNSTRWAGCDAKVRGTGKAGPAETPASPAYPFFAKYAPAFAGSIDALPFAQLIGQTTPCFLTSWNASIRRSDSSTLRPTARLLTVIDWMTPSGSMRKSPRTAMPAASSRTP